MDWRELYFSSQGRINRKRFWLASLPLVAVEILAEVLIRSEAAILLGALLYLAILIPSFIITIKRLHDRDRSGWFTLITVIPLVGAIWLLYLMGYHVSLAVAVGIIALAGLDAETGLVMLLYLDTSFERFRSEGRMRNTDDLWHAIHDGAVKRIRPKTMTIMAAGFGLVPLLWAHGAGADTMRRLAVPMIGGLVTSFALELLIYPVLFYFAKRATLGWIRRAPGHVRAVA